MTESLVTTSSQTVGPFFAIGLPWEDGPFVVAPDTPGAIRIVGRVLDGAGDPVPDALIETWQADPDGRFDHPDDPRGAVASGFRGFGRCPTDVNGRFEFVTLKPGALPGQAPHIAVSVFCRGILVRLVTRIYFPEDNLDDDPVLAVVEPALRQTLVASAAPYGYRFDIVLQGPDETVFFDV
ncbi:protocatechuate 3,4-dioxygenase subunit alpha [Lentzea sp. NBRC 105346]|uniref:protocatechuate 3,4-dioxygenase subunit alpha n=1 Tax=Lentzea sp. NBRC 105346 TaxID=3032205 RepID=UPI0024A2EC23|nr:protocatechuate 3,4-dioxygenase subunit alpha [Lentzea sp. NBRC 105346]GLZ33670.1 protocatechuate 3,4-dioxygenase subunit alpha [Lentzea sp. NBRC 105346]